MTIEKCPNTDLTKPECSCKVCVEALIAEAMKGKWRSSVTDEPLDGKEDDAGLRDE